MNTLPNIIGAFLILLVGWLFIKFVVYLLKKVLKFICVDTLTEKINELKIFGDFKIKFSVDKVITVFVK
ncbi:mechanosensitive ion channel family protein [Patiriisocius sp. Uisw_017]|jgi:hypothetical protein|uniref:mechanosensitive ion channel family protein n=1 Tax=Patiriisocius sp. Uisw_017 TaxID=3230968 RepID=UPI0039ED0C57